MSVKIPALPAVSALTGVEPIPCVQSSSTKKVTTAELAAYSIDTLVAAATATPTTGDYLLGARSTDEKRLTLDLVAAYAVASAWSVATTAGAGQTGDLMLVNRGGTVYDMDVDTLGVYLFASNLAVGATHQGNVLDISGLSAATLGASDEYLVCQSGTAKKVTLANLESKLWTDFRTYTVGLSAVTVGVDSDKFWVDQGGAAKYITGEVLADYILAEIKDEVVAYAWDNAADIGAGAALGNDVLILERSSVLKSMQVDDILSYADSVYAASATITPADDDVALLYRGGVRKSATIQTLASYVTNEAWGHSAITSATGTDVMLVQRSDVTKTITFANFQISVLSGIQATVLNISGLTEATLGDTDDLLVVQGTTAYRTDLSDIVAYTLDRLDTYVDALTDASALADANQFYVLQSGTAKDCTALQIATYVIAEAWTSAVASGGTTGDKLLILNGSTTKTLTIDLLTTYVLTSAQATILDFSTIATSATLAGGATELMAVSQAGTARKVTTDVLTTYVHAAFAAYTAALSEVTALGATDDFYVVQGATPKSVKLSDLSAYIVAEADNLPWVLVAATDYTATPASTSTITFSDTVTSGIAVGRPVKYTYNSVTYYGIVTAVSPNALVTIAGAPLNVGNDITALYLGLPQQVVEMDLPILASYDSGVQDILALKGGIYRKWQMGTACLVAFSVTHYTPDTGAAQPKINVKCNAALVSTADSNKGVQLSTSGAWVDNSAVAISAPTNYEIERGEAIEVRLTEIGTNQDALDLNVSLVFVLQ